MPSHSSGGATAKKTFCVQKVREDFPILGTHTRAGKPLCYLDNAATAQKPQAVIDALSYFYANQNANIDRGVYELGAEATELYERARKKIAARLNAASPAEIVFTRGTTESINLVACSLGGSVLKQGDEILITAMEHHANIVPWQQIAARTGAAIKVAPITPAGELDAMAFENLLTERVKIVAFTHMSNVLGTINDAAALTKKIRARCGAKVLVDGAQAIVHGDVDLQALDCDFYAFSGHKIYGPTGVGVLYGKQALLDSLPPYQTGGDMVVKVSFETATFKRSPHRFEAGTPAIAQAVGLATAFDYLDTLDMPAVRAHEADLLAYASAALREIKGLTIHGNAPNKGALIAFTMQGVHPHDIGTILDSENVCVRAGHHCAQPLMGVLGVQSTARASFALYNTRAEIDALVKALHKVNRMFNE